MTEPTLPPCSVCGPPCKGSVIGKSKLPICGRCACIEAGQQVEPCPTRTARVRSVIPATTARRIRTALRRATA